MQRLLLLILCLSSMWAAQGQVAYDWRYWFDQSPTYEHGSIEGTLHLDVDVSGLSKSLHQIHIQVRDTAGMFSEPVSKYFVVPDDGHGSDKLHYWFDQNNADLHVIDLGNGMFDLDVSHLESGFHTLHFIVTDKYGITSEPMHRGFIRAVGLESLKWRYWFDDALDESVVMLPTATSVMIDVDSLTDGVHYIHFQAMDEHFSETKTQMFIKVPKTMNLDEMYCLVLIDNMLYSKETINMKNGGIATLNLDVKELSQGIHKLDVMVMTPAGALSTVYNSYFVRGFLDDDRGGLKCLYAFDDETDVHETTYSEGLSHLNIDVAHLEDGPHTVRWMLADKEGAYVSDKRSWFIKLPLGGNAVAKYSYWLNDVDSVKHELVLVEPKNPYDLIALLPVETMALRSSCFHFEVKDNHPMMYAKNDIHFTFTDRFDRETNISKQYVDYNVHQEVKDITELMQTQTFERPASNSIKWFKFDSAPGDTITFRSSQATSLQVFAPSGKEIYSTMGDKSVVYGGAHTWEDGTYYVAVHDVTGSKPSITLDYMHMDKYDVVSQDVRVVGNGGCSTITFQGNGFKDLYAVDLKDSKGNIIESIDVGHESDATTTVTFDFTDSQLGKYNAVFHFTEEDKTFANNITVEEAKDIELATKVSFPSTFLRGTSVTYTVEITNKGNMTAYMVPLEMKLIVDNIKNVQSVQFDGFLKSLVMPNSHDFEDLESEDIEDIRQIISNSNDLSQFIIYHDSINGKDYGLSQIIMTLPPNSTQTFSISVKSTANVHFETWTTNDWFPIAHKETSVRRVKSMKAPSRESMCCMKDKFECGAEIVANIAGAFMPPGAGCLSSLSLTGLETAYDVWCSEGNSASERWNNYLKSEGNSLASRLIQSAVTCITGFYGARLKALREDRVMAAKLGSTSEVERINAEIAACRTAQNSAVKSIYDGITTMILGGKCYEAFTETKPNCPPNPGGGGGSSTPVNSLDPNDIYGYIAPSGSKFIGEEVFNIPYRIEFENDTTFATASAHTVIVRDTLDSSKFDLASYQPTSIKIGDKNVQLKGEKEFVTTVDMRPEIYAIAQIEGMYDEKKGIATWKFSSLDPMTMEETDDVMQGFLPVNYDGTGIGEVAYNINRKAGLADGTEISNKASIIFDNNDAIETPVWTNTIDAVPPTSHVSQLEIVGNDSVCVHFEGTDERSGVWKYELYVQHGEGSGWWKEAETDSTCCGFRFYNNIKYSFCVLATDSAGNVERKEFAPEKILYVGRKGDVNTDGEVNVTDIVYTADHILGNVDEAFNASAADMNDDKEINVTDIVYIADEILNGDVDQRSAVKSNRARTVTNNADALTIEPFNIDSGETKVVTLEMNNPGYDITAFQCDVTLPNGLHIAKSGNGKQGVSFNKETKRANASTHSLAAMSKDAGVNRFVCYSITNAPFFGYTGGVIDIPVTADATMADGEYTVLIDNITMTCKDKTQLKPAPVMVKISVNNATSVHSLNADDPSAEYYDAGGRKRDTISKGVNIVRKNDNVNKVIK